MTEQTIKDLLKDLGRLNQSEAGYLLSAIHHHVRIPGKLDLQKEIQFNLEQLALGMIVVYLFSIFEDYIALNTVKEYFPEKTKYFAYRHVRHSFAHKTHGKRANLHKEEFMKEYIEGFFHKTLTWNEADDTIILTTGFIDNLRTFLESVAVIAYNRSNNFIP